MRREHDRDLRTRVVEAPAELLEGRSRARRLRPLFRCAPLGDRDAAVWRDRAEDEAHGYDRRAVTIVRMMSAPIAICTRPSILRRSISRPTSTPAAASPPAAFGPRASIRSVTGTSWPRTSP